MSFEDVSLAQRRVMISGSLDLPTVNEAGACLMTLDGLSAEPVDVLINAGGGDLAMAAALVDVLRLMRAPVTIDVLGRATGPAGVVVAAAPGLRRLGVTASISLHLGQTDLARAPMTSGEMATLAGTEQDLRRRIAVIIGTRSGQTVDWVLHEFERGETRFGNAAVEAGIVDEIRSNQRP